jgi:MFS family permease
MNQKKLYYLMTFLFSMALMGIASQISYYATMRFDAKPDDLAFLAILNGMIYIVLAPVMGHYGSRIMKKEHLLTAGCFCLFLTGIFVYFASSLKMLFIYPPILAFSLSLFYPNMIGSMGQANSTMMISRQAAIFSLGWSLPLTIGPVISGYSLDIFGRLYDKPQLVFPLIGCFALAAGITSLKVHSTINRRPEKKIEIEEVDRTRLPAGGVLFLLLAWICLLLVRSPSGILFNLFPRHGYMWGFSASMVGWLLALYGLSQAAVFWLLSRYHFWHFKQSVFYAAAFTMIIGMILMSQTHSFFRIACLFILFGFSSAITYHMSMFYGLVVSKNKNRTGGIHESILVLGHMTTVYLAANAEKFWDKPAAAYYVGVAVCLIFLLVIAMISLVMRIKKQAVKV